MLRIKRANHPGRLLHRELQARGLTQKQFADIIGKSPVEVHYIINGLRNINTDMAVRLGIALGTSPDVRLGMQHAYDIYLLSLSPDKKKLFADIEQRVKKYVIM